MAGISDIQRGWEQHKLSFIRRTMRISWADNNTMEVLSFLVMYTPNWFRELSFDRLECRVHDKLHISSADW